MEKGSSTDSADSQVSTVCAVVADDHEWTTMGEARGLQQRVARKVVIAQATARAGH